MNRYAEKLAAAIEWMGPRYIGHPDCPKHYYCPDRAKQREKTMLDHATDDELIHYAGLGTETLTQDQVRRLAEIADRYREGQITYLALLKRAHGFIRGAEPYADWVDKEKAQEKILDEIEEVIG